MLIKTQCHLQYIKLKRMDLDSQQNGIAASATLNAVTQSRVVRQNEIPRRDKVFKLSEIPRHLYGHNA
jgi:hypothetical protein